MDPRGKEMFSLELLCVNKCALQVAVQMKRNPSFLLPRLTPTLDFQSKDTLSQQRRQFGSQGSIPMPMLYWHTSLALSLSRSTGAHPLFRYHAAPPPQLTWSDGRTDGRTTVEGILMARCHVEPSNVGLE